MDTIIGKIKEFVRIGKKSNKIHIDNIKNITEDLNDPRIQYDDSSILYDQPLTNYNNFISGDKPKISKK